MTPAWPVESGVLHGIVRMMRFYAPDVAPNYTEGNCLSYLQRDPIASRLVQSCLEGKMSFAIAAIQMTKFICLLPFQSTLSNLESFLTLNDIKVLLTSPYKAISIIHSNLS